jgi:Holliday junction resolvase RusA-like endonuclease
VAARRIYVATYFAVVFAQVMRRIGCPFVVSAKAKGAIGRGRRHEAPLHPATGESIEARQASARCIRLAKAGAKTTGAQSMTLHIVVYGMPGPQGSKRHVGNGRMIESSKKVKPWRQDVKAAALAVRNGAAPIDGPVSVRMVFTLPKPSSAPKRRRTWAMRKPDLSKLARSTEDALTDAGLLADDARIIEFARLAKVFPKEDPEALEAPGVRIEIKPVEAT